MVEVNKYTVITVFSGRTRVTLFCIRATTAPAVCTSFDDNNSFYVYSSYIVNLKFINSISQRF